jgi:hypothetical protein
MELYGGCKEDTCYSVCFWGYIFFKKKINFLLFFITLYADVKNKY